MILPIIRTKIAHGKEWPKHLSTTTFLRLAAPSLGLGWVPILDGKKG